MITKADYEAVKDDLKTISALTRPQIQELLENQTVQLSYFDKRKTVEVLDLDDPNRRYCLCENEDLEREKKRSRLERVEKTRLALEKIELKPEALGAKTDRVFEKYKTRKYFHATVLDREDGKSELRWRQENEIIVRDASIDGCYVIHTNVEVDRMRKNEVVVGYKRLRFVEIAFRNLKTARLELRPVYHRIDDGIRARIFLRMLAYYLQRHLTKRLKPWLEGAGKGRKRDRSSTLAIRSLESIRRNRVRLSGVEFYENTSSNKEQREILEFTKVKL